MVFAVDNPSDLDAAGSLDRLSVCKDMVAASPPLEPQESRNASGIKGTHHQEQHLYRYSKLALPWSGDQLISIPFPWGSTLLPISDEECGEKEEKEQLQPACCESTPHEELQYWLPSGVGPAPISLPWGSTLLPISDEERGEKEEKEQLQPAGSESTPHEELQHWLPTGVGLIPIAFLWASTVVSMDPPISDEHERDEKEQQQGNAEEEVLDGSSPDHHTMPAGPPLAPQTLKRKIPKKEEDGGSGNSSRTCSTVPSLEDFSTMPEEDEGNYKKGGC